MTVYLCTCGTSAFKPGAFNNTRLSPAWVEQQGGVKAAAAVLHASFAQASMADDAALRRQLSAEIHSLARMGLSAQDNVVLYSSETPDGQTCAHAVQRYLTAALPGLDCRVDIVPGLQVDDAAKFRRAGVLNFTQKVLHEIDSHGPAQCVLNPTGGFKSLVPYTVLIGMLKHVPAKYIFEQSTALIALPMMPVEFARTPLETHRAVFEVIQRDSAMPLADWEKAIPYDARTALEPLFEREGAEVTLSPVGLLLWEELHKPTALVPYLSRLALEDLVQMRGIEGTKPDAYLARVAASPAQLQIGIHDNWGQGFYWLKPGAHTRDRYLVSVEGWRLLVWQIADKPEYEALLQRQRSGDVVGQLLRDRAKKYAPFVRMDLYEGGKS